jgi:hypothetical protein
MDNDQHPWMVRNLNETVYGFPENKRTGQPEVLSLRTEIKNLRMEINQLRTEVILMKLEAKQ